MNTIINVDLKNYLKDNLDTARYALIQHPYSEASRISVLAEISIYPLPNDALHLIKEFFKNLSHECISEYINRTDNAGRNILFFCRDAGLLKFIIEYVHDINARCKNGGNALAKMCICTGTKSDEIEIIELLLNYGADINAQCMSGYTPLINYCSEHSPTWYHPNNNFENVVELLISRGACVFTTSRAATMKAIDFVNDTTLLSEGILQLLRGEVSMSRTKSAANV